MSFTNSLQVFIGWDDRERVAFHVLSHSIVRRSSVPVSIVPLVQAPLRTMGCYKRTRTNLESTEFAFSRFLVPYLCNYKGIAIYMDCDMLCKADIVELVAEASRQSDKAILVAQHRYVPKSQTKMDGQIQTAYPRKNWSSLMVFNLQNFACERLTPDYVNNASGLDLHGFQWLRDQHIGTLPLEWNWLVGEYPHNADAKLLHYTLGTPCFDEFKDSDHSDLWFAELQTMLEPLKYANILHSR